MGKTLFYDIPIASQQAFQNPLGDNHRLDHEELNDFFYDNSLAI
jgi:hypothetical protein